MGKYDEFRKNQIEQLNFEKKQKKLQKKHSIDEEKIIVETTNIYKFMIQLFINLINLFIKIIIIGIVFVGVITLLYPDVRSQFLIIFFSIIEEAKGYIL